MYRLQARKQDLPFKDVAISATTTSDVVRLDGIEGLFALQVSWAGGSSVDMALSLELSNDKTNWVEIPTSIVAITAAADTHIWDIQSGAQFVRIKVTVTGGSATFNAAFNGQTR
jgi:allantoicase